MGIGEKQERIVYRIWDSTGNRYISRWDGCDYIFDNSDPVALAVELTEDYGEDFCSHIQIHAIRITEERIPIGPDGKPISN